MNFVLFYFAAISWTMIIYSSLINFFEDHLPRILVGSFRYGKLAYTYSQKQGLITKIQIPKAWFKHFYVIAGLVFTYTLYVTTRVYVVGANVPEWFLNFLNVCCGQDRIAHTPAAKVYLATILLCLQVFRRYYDTHYVSVFGKHSFMSILHYIAGMFHYPGAAIAIVCEAPVFAKNSISVPNELRLSDLSYLDVFATVIFIWAWWHQHCTSKILANLRMDKKGKVISHGHSLPYGDWFNYLSAPHQNAEILMYTCLTILLWYNITWFFVFAWVIINQVETILLSHWWYQKTFKDFPAERKALIPYLY